MKLRKRGRQAFLMLALSHLVFASSVAQADAPMGPASAAALIAGADSHHSRMHFHEPSLRSNTALVLDLTNSTVLFAKRADVASPIASITKLLTALVVLAANQPLDEVIAITDDDRSTKKGAYSRLAVGTQLSRGDLLHLALMSSENRAAHALGRSYPGGLSAFVQAMNAKAWELGMTNAHFVDPAGLSSENVASAEDLSKLVIAASQNATIRKYSTDKGQTVRVGRRMVGFHNTNSLVSNPAWNVIVQKTGYINEAGRCLVMQTVIEDRVVVIVLLNSDGKSTRVADARRVRKWMEARLNERGGARTASNI